MGPIMGNISLRTTTGCSCDIELKVVDEKSILKQVYIGFSMTINWILFFLKGLSAHEYKVVIFDYLLSLLGGQEVLCTR
jgi:hypothetical protein